MTEPVLVRGHTPAWKFLVPIGIGLLLMGGGAVAHLRGEGELAQWLGGAGVLLAWPTALGWTFVLRRRVWVRDTGIGFQVIRNSGDRSFRDDQTLAVALARRANYAEGVTVSTTRRFSVWLLDDGPTERIDMVNTMANDEADPLAALISRLSERMYHQAQFDRSAGRPVLGEKWTLASNELTLTTSRGDPFVCPVSELAAVDAIDDVLCLWRRDSDAIAARVPLDTANAHVLARLLREEVGRQPDAAPTTADDLGRILFERRPSASTRAVLYLATAACGAAAFAFLTLGQGALWFPGIVFGLVALMCGIGAIYARRSYLRAHVHGMRQAGLIGTRTLHYHDVAVLTWSTAQMRHHGIYLASTFTLTLEPEAESRAKRIRYAVQRRNADPQLENLRDHIARVVARRLGARFRAGEAVQWTKNLRLLPEVGVEFRPAGWFGRRAPVVYPFASIAAFAIQQTTFQLWTVGRSEPSIREEITVANFFPGYFLLSELHAAR